MEIERKFLIKTCPDLTPYSRGTIVQAYISVDPVIRLRQMNETYYLTVKSTGHLAREEFELPLTKEQYDTLYEKVATIPIHKTRYFIPLTDTLTAELDIYEKELDGLMTVEVEFASLEEAHAFEAPVWFGCDVSEDARYKNNQLALHGRP